MTRQAFMDRLFTALRALPLISTALLLGAGLAASCGLAWLIWLIGQKAWLRDVAVIIQQLQSLTVIAGGLILVIVVVTVTLAWGRPGKLSFGFRGAQAELDYDDEPKGPPA
jgi:hypothetical protein